MKLKQLLIVAVVLLAAIGAVIALKNSRNKAGEGDTAKVGNDVFPDLKVNDITRVVIAAPEKTVTLVQKSDDGSWAVENRGGYSADMAKLRTFIIDISKLKIAQTTTVGASQLGRLGLLAPDSAEGTKEEKGTRVEFLKEDGGALVKATIGKGFKASGGGDGMGGYATGKYFLVEGNPEVYVISDQLYSLQSDPAQWLKKQDSFRVEKPKAVMLTYPEGEGSFTLSKEEESGKFTLADLSETEELDDAKTGSYGNIFSSESFADVLVGDAATDEKTGLDKATTVDIETFDGFKYVVSIGNKITEGGDEEASMTGTVRYPVRYTVSAELPTERKVEGEETEEQKTERDAAFELKQKTLKTKLENETALAGTIYLHDNWVIDQVLKKRADLIKVPVPEGEGTEGVGANGGLPPGVSVTTLPVPVPPATGEAPREPITATTPPVSLEDAMKKDAEEQPADPEAGEPKEEEPMPDAAEPDPTEPTPAEPTPAEPTPAEPAPAEGEPTPPATEEPAPVPAEVKPETPETPTGADTPETPEGEPAAEGEEDAGTE